MGEAERWFQVGTHSLSPALWGWLPETPVLPPPPSLRPGLGRGRQTISKRKGRGHALTGRVGD